MQIEEMTMELSDRNFYELFTGGGFDYRIKLTIWP